MTYSYSAPMTYVQHEPAVYQQNYYQVSTNKKNSSINAGLAGAGVGLAGGAIVGMSKGHPYIQNGVPTNDFVKSTVQKYIKKAPDAQKLAYNQTNEILSKIKNVQTVEELNALLSNNAEASKTIEQILGTSIDSYIKDVTDKTLSSNKDLIKDTFKNANDVRFANMKNKIVRAWDAEKKAFVKPENMEEEVFNAIKNATGKARGKFIAKYAAIAAAVTGVLAFAVHKILTVVKNRQH